MTKETEAAILAAAVSATAAATYAVTLAPTTALRSRLAVVIMECTTETIEAAATIAASKAT